MPTGWTPENREKYKQSPEYHANYSREWRKENLEKARKTEREYYHRVLKNKGESTYTEKHKTYSKKNRAKINVKNKESYKKNPERHAAYQKKWKDANPDKVVAMRKGIKLKAKYGISLEQFNKMYDAQNGKCANDGCVTCGPRYGKGSLVVDHCHKTDKIRGLLCVPCNTALGFMGDIPERIIGLAAYLRKGNFDAI
jgi:hypothetical protein